MTLSSLDFEFTLSKLGNTPLDPVFDADSHGDLAFCSIFRHYVDFERIWYSVLAEASKLLPALGPMLLSGNLEAVRAAHEVYRSPDVPPAIGRGLWIALGAWRGSVASEQQSC